MPSPPRAHHVRGPIEFSLTLAPLSMTRASVIRTAGPYEFARHVESSATRAVSSATTPSPPRPRTRRRPFVLLPAIAARTEQTPPRHRRVPRRAAPPGEHLRAGVDARPASPTAGRCSVSAPATGRTSSRPTASPFEQRGRRLDETTRGAPQGVDHRQLPSSTASSSSSTTSRCTRPAVQQPHPPIYVGGTSGRRSSGPPGSATRGSRCRWRRCRTWRPGRRSTGRRARPSGTTPRICLMREAWVGDRRRRGRAGVVRPRALSFHRYYWEAGTQGDEHDPVLQRGRRGEDPSATRSSSATVPSPARPTS